MAYYLDFKPARCKDCYKCLRECPVKAIDVLEHQAKIVEDRCILCGHCISVCPQNAKIVHSELSEVRTLLEGKEKVIASVAPSFVSSFQLTSFTSMKIALCKLGFHDAQETAYGAQEVIKEYKKLLESGQYKNLITSACPAACRLIQIYYPKALKYLAPVDSPMIAHAKMLHAKYPDCKIVFLGPCIAKKREAHESDGLIENVLTFEELQVLFEEKGINPQESAPLAMKGEKYANLSKYFPISHGIIQSFPALPKGYEYVSVDGTANCANVLEDVDSLSGVFLEINTCNDSCINGPCSLGFGHNTLKATSEVQRYVRQEKERLPLQKDPAPLDIPLTAAYPRLRNHSRPVTEEEIKKVLAKTGKFKPEDELNCGACGYNTCREKAWAVINGYADIEVCLPYMRKQAENLSYEIIQNSPEGVVLLDTDMNIIDINRKACQLFGIEENHLKGRPAVEFFNPADFMIALTDKHSVEVKKLFIPQTKVYIDLTITLISDHGALFGIMKDVTDKVNYDEQLSTVKMETLNTTDEVIKKQMRVAQEIASLLGETTAETKVALLKLKKTLEQENKGND